MCFIIVLFVQKLWRSIYIYVSRCVYFASETVAVLSRGTADTAWHIPANDIAHFVLSPVCACETNGGGRRGDATDERHQNTFSYACVYWCVFDNDIIYCELPTSFFLYIFKFEAGWKKKTIIKKTGGADAPSFSWPNILFLRTVQCFEEEFLQTKQNTFCTNI